jgi:hypothetical protein
LSILESDGQQSLATRIGLPDRRRASDHFPILMRLQVSPKENYMPTPISQMWPDEISVDVVTPLTRLRVLASELEQRTKGILQARIDTFPRDEGKVEQHFEIVAPALSHYEHQLLIAKHHHEIVYPTILIGEFVDEKQSQFSGETSYTKQSRVAATEKELDTAIGEILRSPRTLSVIQSLIARSKEVSPVEKE